MNRNLLQPPSTSQECSNSMQPRSSIVIRCFNEARHLPVLFLALRAQTDQDFEIIFVDSGSTDGSVDIAKSFGAHIVHIPKAQFTFGRALNLGCKAARGEFLIFLSGHVYPTTQDWLDNILKPFNNENIAASYGKQRGGDTNKFSEHVLFRKWFPNRSDNNQQTYFCNNANCAVRRSLWEDFPYDESLTGLEDLDWAKRVTQATGKRVAYRADAGIIHIHEETWRGVRNRYRRESIAMKQIEPAIRLSFLDCVRLIPRHIYRDSKAAFDLGVWPEKFFQIILFRFNQIYGNWRGFHDRCHVSRQLRDRFYYPIHEGEMDSDDSANDRIALQEDTEYLEFIHTIQKERANV